MPLEENKATMPKTKVKSATLEPNKVPTPSSGSPLIADMIETVASGKAEIRAITKKLTTNSGKRRIFASLEEYLIAYAAHFISTVRNTKNKTKLKIIILPSFLPFNM